MNEKRPAKAVLWTVAIVFFVLFLLLALMYGNTLLFQLMLVAGGSGFLIARRASRKR